MSNKQIISGEAWLQGNEVKKIVYTVAGETPITVEGPKPKPPTGYEIATSYKVSLTRLVQAVLVALFAIMSFAGILQATEDGIKPGPHSPLCQSVGAQAGWQEVNYDQSGTTYYSDTPGAVLTLNPGTAKHLQFWDADGGNGTLVQVNDRSVNVITDNNEWSELISVSGATAITVTVPMTNPSTSLCFFGVEDAKPVGHMLFLVYVESHLDTATGLPEATEPN